MLRLGQFYLSIGQLRQSGRDEEILVLSRLDDVSKFLLALDDLCHGSIKQLLIYAKAARGIALRVKVNDEGFFASLCQIIGNINRCCRFANTTFLICYTNYCRHVPYFRLSSPL